MYPQQAAVDAALAPLQQAAIESRYSSLQKCAVPYEFNYLRMCLASKDIMAQAAVDELSEPAALRAAAREALQPGNVQWIFNGIFQWILICMSYGV